MKYNRIVNKNASKQTYWSYLLKIWDRLLWGKSSSLTRKEHLWVVGWTGQTSEDDGFNEPI